MVDILVFISVVAMTVALLLLRRGLLLVRGLRGRLADVLRVSLRAYTGIYVASPVLMAVFTIRAWILAVARAELSHIYPFMALSYVLIALFSLLIFKENVTALRWAGILVICVGVFLVSRS